MPRSPRFTTPGVLHHVISRFVDRHWYLTSARERDTYLDLLGRALRDTDWRCLAYCLMSNHLHFAMVAGHRSLDGWARRVNSPFAHWLNADHQRLGPVFADRPAVYQVAPEREAQVIAYIHNNPVRAGVVARARSSSWSSHPAYLGRVACPTWLHVAEGLRRAGCANDPLTFDALVNRCAGESLDEPDVATVRREARRVGAFEVGTPTVSDSVEFPIVSRPFVRPKPPVSNVVDEVAAHFGVARRTLSRRYARGTLAAARRVAIHAAAAVGISMSDVAAALHISRQRASKVALTRLCDEESAIVSSIAGRQS